MLAVIHFCGDFKFYPFEFGVIIFGFNFALKNLRVTTPIGERMVILQDNQTYKIFAVTEDQLLNLEGNFTTICDNLIASQLYNVFIKLNVV